MARKLSKEQLKAIHAKRSYQAHNRDNSQRAQHTYPDTAENRSLWVDNPRRIDIEGLDTPTNKGESINNSKTISRVPKGEGGKSTMEYNEDEQKLVDAGYTIITAPNWLIETKFDSAKHNVHVSKDLLAVKIVGETDKSYQVTGTRLPVGDMTDEQKVTILNSYRQTVPVWLPKSQIKVKGRVDGKDV